MKGPPMEVLRLDHLRKAGVLLDRDSWASPGQHRGAAGLINDEGVVRVERTVARAEGTGGLRLAVLVEGRRGGVGCGRASSLEFKAALVAAGQLCVDEVDVGPTQ